MDEFYKFIAYWQPITDWIQAVGAIIAIIAGTWGIITLFIKDKDKEKQIKSLVNLAKESQKQTNELIKQTKQMIVQNEYNAELLKLNIDSLSIQKDNSETEKQKLRIEKNRHLKSIRPVFAIPSVHYGIFNDNKFLRKFVNDGLGTAKVTRYEFTNETVELIFPVMSFPFHVKPNETLSVYVSYPNTNRDFVKFDANIYYEDPEGNEYVQTIEVSHIDILPLIPKLLKEIT